MNQSWLGEHENVLNYGENIVELLGCSPGIYFFVWDLEKDRIFQTPSIQRELKLNAEMPTEFMQELGERIHKHDRYVLHTAVNLLKSGVLETYSCHIRLQVYGKEYIWFVLQMQSQTSKQGSIQQIYASFTKVNDETFFDSVTGLRNQHQMVQDFQTLFDTSETGYMMILDIDDFNTVNVRYGREFGNHLLIDLARILYAELSKKDYVYRLDGDRFAVVFTDSNEMVVRKYFTEVNTQFQEICRSHHNDIFATVSGGTVCFPSDGEDFNRLYQFADSALHTAKKMGKSCLIHFAYEVYERYIHDVGMREDLQRCVKDGFESFELNYQPQISTVTGRVEGAEALLRWCSKEHGKITPNVFVPLLEKHGLICEVGRWVIDTALVQCKKWREIVPHFCMSINLSYIQFEKDDIAGILLECLEKHNLPGDAVLLELTESNQLQNYNFYNETLSYLNRIGVMVAIDDFGTGYSSLGYFKELNINQIKIDRCFVTRIRDSEYDFKLIEFIINLAHSINVSVCVEGVESEDELNALLPLAPDYIQGFYFGKPKPADVFESNFLVGKTKIGKEFIHKIAKATSFVAAREQA